MKKLTKLNKFEMLLAVEEVKANPVLVEFIEHEMGLLAKKNRTSTGDKKLTKTQEENEDIKTLIIECLSKCETPKAIKELQKEFEELADFSNQKLSALIRQLVASEEIIRIEEKRVAYFQLATLPGIEEEVEQEEEIEEECSEEEEVDDELQILEKELNSMY